MFVPIFHVRESKIVCLPVLYLHLFLNRHKIKMAMKYFLNSLFFSFIFSVSFSQSAPDDSNDQHGTINDLKITSIRIPSLQEVGGSPFMTPDYKIGVVQVDNNTEVNNVPMKFNIFNNALMIQRDGFEYKLESFRLATYDITENDGSVKHFMFGQGYPDVEKNSARTVYQVLSVGPKAHLLKLLSQKVEDAATLGDYSRREIVTTEQFYIYVPGGEIKKIKPGKKDILAALPAYSSKIDEIAGANNLKLKSESDLTILFEELNKP